MNLFKLIRKSEKLSKPEVSNKSEMELQTEPAETESTKEVQVESEVNISDSGTQQTEGKKRVYNLIILDESGSMMSIYRPALTGLNETLRTIRATEDEHPDQEHLVSVIAFDSNHYNEIYKQIPAKAAKDISEKQYRPAGGTPLYDAMGRSLNELRPTIKNNDIVLVTIITDGYENASREYNGRAIKALVESLKIRGWVFTYIGANQDVKAVACSMSIDNCLAFGADDEGTGAMFEQERSSRKRFFEKISKNCCYEQLGAGYFDELDDDKTF